MDNYAKSVYICVWALAAEDSFTASLGNQLIRVVDGENGFVENAEKQHLN